jgi:hypothetical protein
LLKKVKEMVIMKKREENFKITQPGLNWNNKTIIFS